MAFPEMFLTGYPVEDLALRKSFIDASRATLAALPGRLAEAAWPTSRSSSGTSTRRPIAPTGWVAHATRPRTPPR